MSVAKQAQMVNSPECTEALLNIELSDARHRAVTSAKHIEEGGRGGGDNGSSSSLIAGKDAARAGAGGGVGGGGGVFAADEKSPTLLEQGGAALFYATASLVVIFVNKIVLTTMGFPSFCFIALSQFTATCFVIGLLRVTNQVKIVRFDRKTGMAVAPLMILFLLNTVSGLGGTQHINLPMFTVLRRFSILMTMLLERFVLKSTVSFAVQLSVGLMIGGALLAAVFDLKFELTGYLLILSNDFFTAAYGVSVKRALNHKIPQISLLYFNSLFGATVMTLVIFFMPQEARKIVNFEGWRDPSFLFLYLCTSFMGSVLQYSIFVCTRVNSALTTSVVGCLKNLLTTVVGMLGMGADYEYDEWNCMGLAVSMGGSFLYSWAKITKR